MYHVLQQLIVLLQNDKTESRDLDRPSLRAAITHTTTEGTTMISEMITISSTLMKRLRRDILFPKTPLVTVSLNSGEHIYYISYAIVRN